MPYTSYSVILMQFRFEAINSSDLDRVKFIFLSPSQGYIQTPRCLNAFFQSCATITPPAGQGIFITQNGTADIKHLHWPLFSQGPCGQIYTTDKPPDPVVFWSTTSMSLLYKELPKSWGGKEWERLHFIQTVYKKQNCMKVNIVFSFQQNKPQKIGSKWNCSRSEWPGLYQQFPCDRQCQCVDGEDETKCFYYSEHCGPDKFTAEGGCYVYFDDVENGLDIRKSKRVCERTGGVLAIFESTKQWSSVISTLENTNLKPFYMQIDINVGVSAMKTSEDIFKENMYINTWQWGDGSIAYNFHASFHHVCNQDIVKVYENESHSLNMRLCAYNQAVIKVNEHLSKKMSSKVKGVLCKVSLTDNKPHEKIKIETIHDLTASHVPLVTCLLGYVTHVAMSCDSDSLCTGKMERRGVSRTAKCKAAQTQFSPYFRCEATDDYVSYSVVCDWRQDCKNNSDESFCQFPPCAKNTFNCGQGQCIDIRQVCDNFVNCWTTRDEKHCPPLSVEMVFNVTNPPALVNFDRPGGFSLIPLPGNTTRCPDSHFHCPGNGYCLPVYTRCNGVTDCPGREDETGCDKLTCEGLYQCRGNDREICLHVDHLCDEPSSYESTKCKNDDTFNEMGENLLHLFTSALLDVTATSLQVLCLTAPADGGLTTPFSADTPTPDTTNSDISMTETAENHTTYNTGKSDTATEHPDIDITTVDNSNTDNISDDTSNIDNISDQQTAEDTNNDSAAMSTTCSCCQGDFIPREDFLRQQQSLEAEISALRSALRQTVSTKDMTVFSLTEWLARQTPSHTVKKSVFHVGVNDCYEPQTATEDKGVTKQQWVTLISQCHRVFPRAAIQASSIIPAKGRHPLNAIIGPSNISLREACSDMKVLYTDHHNTFTTLKGAPRLALYSSVTEPSKRDVLHVSQNLFSPKRPLLPF
ncbi:uncharacterized protein LOC143289408 [Babylonia areolata]|uniref:uncharacterized protein LOC143289408 n=1 Tax=Babylonia areolata TaxID=304850 RepID=UPI003FD29A8C